jgi:hypothetical protein
MSQPALNPELDRVLSDLEAAAGKLRMRLQTNRDLHRIQSAIAADTRNARREGTVVGGIIAAAVVTSQVLPLLG